MIKISMKRFNKVVELKRPTEYEHVMLSLWRLGLQRDPAKYTLRELSAVISYDTAWEYQMTRLVSVNDMLQDIVRVNRIIVDASDWLIAYIRHSTSNSQKILDYALRRERKGLLRIHNLAVQESWK